jgi:hypothetical protein
MRLDRINIRQLPSLVEDNAVVLSKDQDLRCSGARPRCIVAVLLQGIIASRRLYSGPVDAFDFDFWN